MSLHIPPALKHRRFRLLWLGLLFSVAGSRMQFAALLWHIRELSDQPIALGGIGLARVIPIIIFSLIGGAVADVFDRRKIMFITQGGLIGTAAALAWLTWTDQIQLWHIYALTVCEAIAVGGDVDTTAAMAGAISGARNGIENAPANLVERLNDQGTWRSAELADLASEAYIVKMRGLAH